MKSALFNLLLAVVVLCGLLTGCSGSARKPEVTVIVKVPVLRMTTYADSEIDAAFGFLQKAGNAFAEQYDAADVTFKVVEFELTREDQEIPACFDTPEAVDVLYEGFFNMSTYIHTGRVVPLDDIISSELRADIPQSFWESSQFKGRTYMLPFLGLQNTICFNAELFRQAGLEEFVSGDPQTMQNWTQEEWEYILQTLKENLPDLVSPMMMYAGDEQGDTHIMTLLRCFGCPFFDEDGRVHVNTPEGIAALRWIKECNDKGYFPSGPDTLVVIDNYNQFIHGMLAIFFNNVVQEDACSLDGGFEMRSANFPDFSSPDGAGLATTFLTGFEVFDNGDEAKLAASKAFVQYIYESEFIDYMAGAIPCSTSVAEKYASELKDIAKYVGNSGANWNFTGNHPNWRGVRAAFYPNIQDLLFGDKTPEEVAANIDAACNAAIDEGYASMKLHE
ncbi:MAG: extracellular solute-binding protein [Oscillospiraceae bacterium]|nr:extracellular solute-binding protein [Oscillospiraceae bacterium]